MWQIFVVCTQSARIELLTNLLCEQELQPVTNSRMTCVTTVSCRKQRSNFFFSVKIYHGIIQFCLNFKLYCICTECTGESLEPLNIFFRSSVDFLSSLNHLSFTTRCDEWQMIQPTQSSQCLQWEIKQKRVVSESLTEMKSTPLSQGRQKNYLHFNQTVKHLLKSMII